MESPGFLPALLVRIPGEGARCKDLMEEAQHEEHCQTSKKEAPLAILLPFKCTENVESIRGGAFLRFRDAPEETLIYVCVGGHNRGLATACFTLHICQKTHLRHGL